MQQNTITFERANPLQQMVGLSRAIALPHEFQPQRFPSFPALERTAVLGFNSPTATTVPSTGLRGLLMRQASYPLWLDYAPTTPWSYSVYYAANGDVERIIAGGEISLRNGLRQWAIGNQTRSLTVSGVSGTSLPLTNYPVVAYDYLTGPNEWLWVPAGATLCIDLGLDAGTIPTSDPSLSLWIDSWTSPGQTANNFANFSLIFTGSTVISYYGTYVASSSLWLRPSKISVNSTSFIGTNANFSLSATVIGSSAVSVAAPTSSVRSLFTATGSSVVALMPAVNPPEFQNSPLPYASTRTTATACLFTNVTKILNKEGTVLAGRLSPVNTSVWNFTTSQLSVLHPAEKQFLPLETGFYTYCPPSSDLADFWDYTLETGSGAPPAPVVRLDNSSLVNCFNFADPDGGTSLALNLDIHVEFRTSSELWPIGLSTMSLESLHQAQLALVAVGFFFPNDTHKGLLTNVVPKLKSALSMLAPYASSVNPALGIAARMGSVMLSSRPGKTPAGTTLKGSGAMPKPAQKKQHQKGQHNKPKNKPKGKK